MLSRIITLILSVFILLGTFVWTGEIAILVILGVVIVMLLFGLVFLLYMQSKIKTEIKVKNSTINGEPLKVYVTVHNPTILPVFSMSVKINAINMNFGLEAKHVNYFSVCGRESKEAVIDIQCQYCGKYYIIVDYVKLYDFWGIFSKKQVKVQKYETCMYPQYYLVNSISQVMRTNYEKEKYFSHKKGENLSELLQYREYQKGDSLKLINWKLSGKYDELMIREFDTPTDNQLLITFDTFNDEPVYKNIVYTVLTSVSLTYAENNITHYISWYNPMQNKIENYSIDSYEDVFRVIRMIFETETEEDHMSIGYLIENKVIDKYAKIIYITNKLTEGIQKEIAVIDKINAIIVDETTFNKDNLKKTVGMMNV